MCRAFGQGRYAEALALYSDAIALAPLTDDLRADRAVFYCNRSACHTMLEDYEAALEDANDAIHLNEHYLKAYLRRAAASHHLERFDDALQGLLSCCWRL